MTEKSESLDIEAKALKKRTLLRKASIAAVAFAVLISLFAAGLFVNNNVSFVNNTTFSTRLDGSIKQAEEWIKRNEFVILAKRNSALIRMLRFCDKVKANPPLNKIVTACMDHPTRHYTSCLKREVDPNWPVTDKQLELTLKELIIDGRWGLYAAAPEQAKLTPQQLQLLFDPERSHYRRLTHQLYALVLLREREGANEQLDKLIEHLCNRLRRELVFDMAVVDIQIQKVSFVLMAGFPEKIHRRWVERIISNQLPDGGWNDRWFCLTSARRPKFDFSPSNQHATIQALTALYLVRHRYPEHFGLK